jgi:hypothetical protein
VLPLTVTAVAAATTAAAAATITAVVAGTHVQYAFLPEGIMPASRFNDATALLQVYLRKQTVRRYQLAHEVLLTT